MPVAGAPPASTLSTQPEAPVTAPTMRETTGDKSPIQAAPAAPLSTPASSTPLVVPIPVPASPLVVPGKTRLRQEDGMLEVYVPAGEFLMGSDDGHER